MPRIRMAWAAGLATVVVAAGLAGCGSSAAFSAQADWLTLRAPASARPGFFIDNEAWNPAGGYAWSDFSVRRASTGGQVLASRGRLGHLVTAAAAIGRGRAFIVAEEAPMGCASQLYWFRLDSRGKVGPLLPVGGALNGEVDSLAASWDGRTIAYTLSGCVVGDAGYLKVLDVRTGHTRRWGSVDLTGSGSLGTASNLSLSANGKLLAFVGWSAGLHRASVRVLATRGPGGNLAKHSRTVLHLPSGQYGAEPDDAIAISPDGTAFYLCTVTAQPGTQVTSVASYRTGTGQLLGSVARLPARNPAHGRPLPGCAMSVSQGDGFALVPFAVRYPRPGSGLAVLSVADIDLASGIPATFSFPVRQDPAIAGPGAGVSIAW